MNTSYFCGGFWRRALRAAVESRRACFHRCRMGRRNALFLVTRMRRCGFLFTMEFKSPNRLIDVHDML